MNFSYTNNVFGNLNFFDLFLLVSNSQIKHTKMIIQENRPHKLGDYLKSEVFRNRRSYKYEKDISQISWKQPNQARFKLVMKKGRWIQPIKGKSFAEFVEPYYSKTCFSFDTDLKTYITDEQKGLINLVRLINKRINSNVGWNYARIYMTLCPKKNTKDNLYNSIALNLTYDGRIIANDSVKFQQYTCTAQKDHLIINPVVYEWQRLN